MSQTSGVTNTAESPAPAGESRCARCGGTFVCGMLAGASECWCVSLPPLTPSPGRGCLCRACLDDELRTPQST